MKMLLIFYVYKITYIVAGKSDKIIALLFQGYDHILDVVDEGGVPISEVVAQRGDKEMNDLLTSIPAFEVINILT